MSLETIKQPDPVEINGAVDVNDWLLAYIKARADAGEKKYGTRLMAPNGRKSLYDLLDELLDSCVYTAQTIIEIEQHLERLDELENDLQEYYEKYGPLEIN